MPAAAPFTGRDVAVLIPTKDRPGKLRALLESLAAQTKRPGRVLVVDGGGSVRELTEGFSDRLDAEYLSCLPPGQLRQRKMGLDRLDASTRLVCLLDDDMVLEPEALAHALAFLNGPGQDAAGVGLNLVNEPALAHSRLTGLLLLSGPEPGRVLPSGRNTSICNVTQDIRTEWLGGGYTIWRQGILLANPQEDIRTRWAIGEDLRFSYPLGKRHALHVCAAARARHEHVQDQAPPLQVHAYRARKEALALFYFASAHPELSRLASLWAILGGAALWALAGLRHRKPELLRAAQGRFGALGACLRAFATGSSVRKDLED